MNRPARIAGTRCSPQRRHGPPGAARLAILCAVLAALGATGCEKSFRNMYDQPRYKPLAASPLWPDGRASRPPVAGTVPRSQGTAADTASGRGGSIALSPVVPVVPAVPVVTAVPVVPAPPLSAPLAAAASPPSPAATRTGWTTVMIGRGQQRYDIYCAPCHGAAGDGDGMIARRGFPHPPSLHDARLRNAEDGYLVSVITHGYGAMYPYADRVAPADRQAIVAYIRALQLSRNATLADVPAAARATLEQAR